MVETVLRGRLLKWGHSVGIRLRSKDARRLPANVGDEVTVRIEAQTSTIDPDRFQFYEDKQRDAKTVSHRHDAILAEGRAAELRGRRR